MTDPELAQIPTARLTPLLRTRSSESWIVLTPWYPWNAALFEAAEVAVRTERSTWKLAGVA